MIPAALKFGAPWWLWGLASIPLLAALLLWAERESNRRLIALLPAPRLRAQLTGAASVARRRWRYAFLLLGLAGLVSTLAQPRWGYEFRETHRRGLDLIVIVDVSKSMLATDVTPTRLARAKLTLQDLVTQLGGDRLGLVAFAGTAFLQAPLTIDYDDVLTAADELDTDLIPMGGTNIGGAIDLALEAFGKAEAGNRAILLLSDGEPTADSDQADGVKAAERAAEAGVKVFTLGFGTPEGSLIPLTGTDKGEFVRDADGQIVRTRLNESGLQEIAKAGEGFYVRAGNGEEPLRNIMQNGLSHLKAAEIDARTDRRPIERYQWPLGLALLALGLGGLLGERRKSSAPAASVKAAPRARPRRTAAAVAIPVWMAVGLCCGRTGYAAAMTPPPAADAAPGDALKLYQAGHYDQAYSAFEDLAKQHPKIGGLPFDAGASAYMGKQYDQALDAFGRALASNDPTLQAQSHYNFGNALFRRGEAQQDQKAKISDWRNALQHYDTTLKALQAKPPHSDDALASNTAYNRGIVQQRIDEALKQPPPQQQKKDDKQDQKDKKDQSQEQQQPQPSGEKKDQQDQQQQGQQNQPKPGGNSDSKDSAEKKSGQPDGSPSPGQSPPEPSPAPNQDKPRQRGDFNAQPEKSAAQPKPDSGDQKAEEAKEEDGKMSEAQARALLQSLKDEDAKVNLHQNPEDRQRRDEPVGKDW